ncbi:hypothetical protein HID58_079503 [Brassica napus]|uniref:t-SNARE coiled-coil homology domain-containing protein n=1 Tax=Brassica napus TaxID=3708 RepID=A0ABQ7Y276_BRANA|nr:hypothetical protein HID58_079503 [Brassica napus]
MASDLPMSPHLEQIHGEIQTLKDVSLFLDFDRELKDGEARNSPQVNKQLNDEKQSMVHSATRKLIFLVRELDSAVNPQQKKTYKCLHVSLCLHEVAIGSLKLLAATSISNQELVDAGMKRMDEIEHSKQVVHQTVEIDTQTAANLKGQADQMGRVGNDLDTIQFSIKKASQLVKEIERQFLNAKANEAVATDTCIMMFLFLIVGVWVLTLLAKQMVDREPNNKDIRDIQ